MDILNKIEFELAFTTMYDFCENLINKLFLPFQFRFESERNAVQTLTNYIARSVTYSRNFLDKYHDLKALSTAIVKFGVFAANKFFDEPVIHQLIVNLNEVEDFKILELACGEAMEDDLKIHIVKFRENFPNLSALQHFDEAQGFFSEIFG